MYGPGTDSMAQVVTGELLEMSECDQVADPPTLSHVRS